MPPGAVHTNILWTLPLQTVFKAVEPVFFSFALPVSISYFNSVGVTHEAASELD